MFCSKCGKPIAEGARFCGSCGASQIASAQPASDKRTLYMDAKGLTLMNYKFDIKDAEGNVRYRAATVTEGLVTYNARIYNADDSEAMIIRQQKKLTLASMNFDIFDPQGKLVTDVIQKIHFTSSEFQLRKLDMIVTGDFLSLNFAFKRGNQVVCKVHKKVLAWGDCYELEYTDPELEKVLLAAIMVIQMAIAATRNKRRR